MKALRQSIIKLAHENPELRRHLVPLLRQAGDWERLEGSAKEKAMRILGLDGHFSFVDLSAKKFGRKTVFLRYHGMMTLYAAGDDGQVYSVKLHGMPTANSISYLLEAATHGMTPEAKKEGVYTNGRLRI